MNIQDIRTKGITLTLDKPRVLKFTLNSFAELEDRFGSIDAAMEVLQSGSIKSMRTLLWTGLMHEDESLTEKQVGNFIGIHDLENLAEAISQAMGEAMPKVDPSKQVTPDIPEMGAARIEDTPKSGGNTGPSQ